MSQPGGTLSSQSTLLTGNAIPQLLPILVIQMSANVLLIVNVFPYYTTVVEAAILLLAVLATTLSKESTATRYVKFMTTKAGSLLRGTAPVRGIRSDFTSGRDGQADSYSPLYTGWFIRFMAAA